ncbi:hypothetical protein [Sphingomonas sp.]|jgi:hypothetical protein|nr:hypothetical protein [Sphingomonas sp.]HEU0045172.1 hypothetical protein [Sphingomonas sp.]
MDMGRTLIVAALAVALMQLAERASYDPAKGLTIAATVEGSRHG